jgi:phosphatidate cytidylyltransferase
MHAGATSPAPPHWAPQDLYDARVLTRILTAACLLPVVAAIYWGPEWLFLLLAILASLLMTRETLRLFRAIGANPVEGPVLVGVAALGIAFRWPQHAPPEAVLALAVAACFGAWMLLREGPPGALASLGAMLFALLYPGLLMGFQVGLRGLDLGGGPRQAPALLVFLYASVFGGDAGAYFTGRFLGRIKLAPRISPKKTVEGFLGGIVAGVLLGTAFAVLLPTGLPAGKAAFVAGLLAVTGAFGDLTKSLLKRAADVKDSGTLLPGHGGILDRLDGLLLASPVLFLVLTSPVLRGDLQGAAPVTGG